VNTGNYILWLPSWYPTRHDPYAGDFIQRHAKAAAINHKVHVIFVTETDLKTDTEQECNHEGKLTEQIIYFKRKHGLTGKIRKQLAWRRIYKTAIEDYIGKNGLPACVHVHVPWKAGLIALWMKKKFGTEFLITEHWGIYNRIIEDNFYQQSKLKQALIKKLFKTAKAFASVSVFLAKSIEEMFGKKADVIIPNVVDTSLFFYQNDKYSSFTFIHVSNMVPLKNVKGILEAFKRLLVETGADSQLVMVGNPDDTWTNYAEQLHLPDGSVSFTGEVSYTKVAEHMRRSHCLVLNSLIENSPCVIGEALCCGLPVVATEVGGVPELVNLANSKLIPSQNVPALAAAMVQMYKDNSNYNNEQIAGEAHKKFSYSTISFKFDELYGQFG
jgi:glycosyltransferase involved in cell wall biosynthesis